MEKNIDNMSMEKEIAVLVDKCGNISSGTSAAAIVKFTKEKRSWKEVSKIDFSCICKIDTGIESDLDAEEWEEQLKKIREDCKEIADRLGNCRIIIGKSISGLMYKVFSSKDFVILETEKFTPDMLDDIYDMALKANEPHKKCELPLEPQETDVPGEYFFDFKQLKLKYRITSKETIRPFLAKRKFSKLIILCDHRMPWLDDDLKRLQLACEEIRDGSNVTLIIEPIQ